MTPETRLCRDCSKELPLDHFYPRDSSWCARCVRKSKPDQAVLAVLAEHGPLAFDSLVRLVPCSDALHVRRAIRRLEWQAEVFLARGTWRLKGLA